MKLDWLEADEKYHSRVEAGLTLRQSEKLDIELLAQLTNVIQFWQQLFKCSPVKIHIKIPVDDSETAGWHSCKCGVIQLDGEVIETGHCAVAAEISEEELRHSQNGILVEKVQHKGCDREVSCSSMDEH